MRKNIHIFVLTLLIISLANGKKISGSRSSGSSRGSSGRTSYKVPPTPTSHSYSQPSAPKPTLFGWQEKPVQNSQTFSSWQSKPASGQSHSYPSSQTGLSGNNPPKQPPKYEENVQRNIPSQNSPAQRSSYPNNQPSHSYPASNGLSGNSGSGYPLQSNNRQYDQFGSGHQHVPGNSYPQNQGTGLSGAGVATSNQGYRPVDTNRPYNGGYQNNNYGNYYQHPQGMPPPYTPGSNYGGFGGQNPGYASQMPGYFGNYGKSVGGPSRTGSALTGVGIAGAGIGTILTGLALWNLARSSGHTHHTVIYDNRGQPVAVAPANDTGTTADPILANLVNCSLTISNDNATEIIAIPCAIASSFSPDATVQEVNSNNGTKDNTKCTVTVLTKEGREYMTTIPCSTLLNTAAENNVTEPPLTMHESKFNDVNDTMIVASDNSTSNDQPLALKMVADKYDINNNITNYNCTPESGNIRDPINPCFSITHDLTVIPLPKTATTNAVDIN